MIKQKKVIFKEFDRLRGILEEENPDKNIQITRDYFTKHSKISKTKLNEVFSSFTEAKNEYYDSRQFIEEKLTYEKKIQSLENKTKELEREKKDLLNSSIDEDNILNTILENRSKNFNIKQFKVKPEVKTNKDFIMHISDAHIGEVVKPEDVNYVNAYNSEIFIERMDHIHNKLIGYSKKIPVNTLHYVLNGDMVSGGIHQELARNSEMNEVESLFFVEEFFTKNIVELSKYFNKINIYVIVGNHSRILPGKPYFKEKTKLSWEYLIGRLLQKNFKDFLNIEVKVPESAFDIIQVRNTKFLITHGDILTGAGSGGFLGLPAYSIASSSAKMYGVLHQVGVNKEQQFDNILIGHLHSTAKIPLFTGGFCFVNGCICGTNEFSLFKMKSVAKKEQTLLVVDDDGVDSDLTIKFE